LGLCSQSWADFPKVIVELATSVFLLGSGTEQGRRELAQLFGLDSHLETALERLGKPTAAGAELIALFRAAGGTTKHLLTNTVPPALLWAFSTTSEDMTVRNSLYERFGVTRTLKVLSERHPYGLKAEVERLRLLKKMGRSLEKPADVLIELTESLAALIETGSAAG
jgi:intracellular multiplication protein IcmB